MTCPACAEFERNPNTGRLHAACAECVARHLAKSPEHAESAKAKQILPPYEAALERIYGTDWEAGHHKVRTWAKRLATLHGRTP